MRHGSVVGGVRGRARGGTRPRRTRQRHGTTDPANARTTASTTWTHAAPAALCSSPTTPTTRRSTTCTAAPSSGTDGRSTRNCLHADAPPRPGRGAARGARARNAPARTCPAMRLNRRRDRSGHATAGRFGSSALHTHAEVARVADLHRREPRRAPASPTTRDVPLDVAPGDARPRAGPARGSTRVAAAPVRDRSPAGHRAYARHVTGGGGPVRRSARDVSCRRAATRPAILLAASRRCSASPPRATRSARPTAASTAPPAGSPGSRGITAATDVPRTSADALRRRHAAGRRHRAARRRRDVRRHGPPARRPHHRRRRGPLRVRISAAGAIAVERVR